jgi:ubiquitin-protein ligase
MSRDAVFAEAEQILAVFPEFWAVDENVYHLYGIVEKTGVTQFTVEILFPKDFPKVPPQVRVSKEILELLNNRIDLKTLINWQPGKMNVVDVLKELKSLIDRNLENDYLDLKTAPKDNAPMEYTEFVTPEPFEFSGSGEDDLRVRHFARSATRDEEANEPEAPTEEAFVPDHKKWSEDSFGQEQPSKDNVFDEVYWTEQQHEEEEEPRIINEARIEATVSPEVREQLDMIMMEYSSDIMGPGDVNVYLSVSVESTFLIRINFARYPQPPIVDFPPELISMLPDPQSQLKVLRTWNASKAPAVVDILHELESRLWSLNDIESRIKRIFGEFEAAFVQGSRTAVNVTILTYGFQEYHVTIDLKNFPDKPTITYSPNLASLIRSPPTTLKVLQGWDTSEEKEPVAIIREINWLVDKESRMAFEIDLLKASLKEVRYNAVSKPPTIVTKLKGTMKTEETSFDFKATLPDNYPMSPPRIDITSEIDEESMETKMQAALKSILDKWSPQSSYLIDAFNAISKAIFEVSVVSCIICHKFECPTCKEHLDSEDPNEATCKVVCPYCERSYHKHCWDQTIATFGKCGFCLRPPPANMMP